MKMLTILMFVSAMKTQHAAASPNRMPRGSVCFDEPAVIGPCEGLIERWTHSPSIGCYPFPYGGCGGNKNNFPTKRACEEFCLYPF